MKTIAILTITMLLAQPEMLAQPAYFTRVTDGPIGTDVQRSWGCALVDYDNDGRVDVFVAGYDPYRSCFFRNDTGMGNATTFTHISAGGWVNTVAASVAAAWGDYDGDGDLDLLVVNSYD